MSYQVIIPKPVQKQLDDLPEELRELVVRIITTPPVNQFLKLSHFQQSPTKRIPFTYVEPYQFAS
jgi:mRNA-degrading endonuclease RelE of RelBE toxin-antitoxin system